MVNKLTMIIPTEIEKGDREDIERMRQRERDRERPRDRERMR